MNKYKKKKNFLQTLFKFDWVLGVIAFLAITVVPFLIGLPAMKIPYFTSHFASHFSTDVFYSWLLGFTLELSVIMCVSFVILLKMLVPNAIREIARDLHATKIMQRLPLSEDDWKQFDVKTDEDAVHVLRDLVKTIGFNDDLINCYELRDQITASYHAFLRLKYGDWDIIFYINDDVLIGVDGLVLCSDADFDAELKAERKKSRERRERWLARKKDLSAKKEEQIHQYKE